MTSELHAPEGGSLGSAISNLEEAKRILLNAPGLLILVDDKFKVRYVNRIIGGYDEDMVIGSPVIGFLKESYQESQLEKLKSTLNDGKIHNNEVKVIFADGSEHWMQTQLSRTSTAEGEYNIIIFAWIIDDQKLAERELKLSEAKFRTIAENVPETIFVLNKDNSVAYANRTLGKLSPDDLLGRDFPSLWDKDQRAFIEEKLKHIFDKGHKVDFETKMSKRGKPIWQGHRAGPIEVMERIEYAIVSITDITEQKLQNIEEREFNRRLEQLVQERTEDLENANKEIRVLLKEMHHRVKNNLQLVSSLLNLQSSFVDDERTSHILQESINRINSMSLIHKSLYYNQSLSDIDVREYIDSLVRERINTNSLQTEINYEVNIPDVNLTIDTMVPLGLLINELVTNSIKHAFNDQDHGKVSISITRSENNYTLIYEDNGSGISRDESESESDSDKSLGLELIECFVEQLNGDMEFSSSAQGIECKVRFIG